MTYNLDYICRNSRAEFAKAAGSTVFSDKKLYAPQYEDAIVLPAKEESVGNGFNVLGGVVDCNGSFLASSAWTRNASGFYDYDCSQLQSLDKAIYIGNHVAVWGHVLTDSMKKLWYLYTEECRKLLDEGFKIVYVGFNNAPAPDYVFELFRLAGLELKDFVQILKPTICHKLVLPDSSFFVGGCTKEYIDVINRIKSKVPAIDCDSIYFARKGCHNAQIEYGEGNITNYLRGKGFSIQVPEMLTVQQQVGLLKGCKCFAATEGSISHNSIFCEPGAKHIIIRKTDFVNPYSLIVNCASGLDVTYIDSHHSTHLYDKHRPWHGPYYMQVSSMLKRYFGDFGFSQIRWFDREWYRYLLIKHQGLHKFLYNLFKCMKKTFIK